MTFSAEAYENLSRLKSKLTTTAQDVFYVINEFAKAYSLETVKLYLVDDRLQDLRSDNCEFFQLYFYTNIFLSVTGSQVLKDQKLTNTAIEKFLNEILTLNIDENEKAIEEFAQKMEINRN